MSLFAPPINPLAPETEKTFFFSHISSQGVARADAQVTFARKWMSRSSPVEGLRHAQLACQILSMRLLVNGCTFTPQPLETLKTHINQGSMVIQTNHFSHYGSFATQ